MTSPELPEPELDLAAGSDGGAARRSRAAWAVVAVSILVLGIVVIASRSGQPDDTDVDIGLPLPQQVLMGGQTSTLGSDPDRGIEANVWLNVSGPGASTSTGDLFHAGSAQRTTPGTNPPTTTANESYDPNGHLFAVTVGEVEAGRSLVIDAFDPAWVYVGDNCELDDGHAGSDGQSDQGGQGGAYGQYRGNPAEATPRCTGDQYLGSDDPEGDAVTTTYLVRAPDATPADSTDNPVVCASTYAGWPLGPRGGPDRGAPSGTITESTYQAWDGLCRIAPSHVRAGAYIVQVRTNADLGSARWSTEGTLAGDAGSLVDADPSASGQGMNRFALRAGWDGDQAEAAGVTIQAVDHLSLYVNRTDATAAFSLVRIPSAAAGRTLHLGFWDLGDVSGGSGLVLTVGAPADARTASEGSGPAALECEVMAERTADPALQIDGCTVGGITSKTFNAAMLDIRVRVPTDYRCDAGDDCWLPLRLAYAGTRPNDTTTWLAEWEQDGSTPRESPGSVPGTQPPTTGGTIAPSSTSTSTPSGPTSTTSTSTTSTSTAPTSTTGPASTTPPGTTRPSNER